MAVVGFMKMEIEQPYFDKNGTELKEFAVIKVFHFIGGRRKKHYMYHWIRLKESQGKLYWCAYHLVDATESSYWLKAVTNEERKILSSEIVACYAEYR